MSVFENHDPDSLIGTVVDGRFEIESEQSRSSLSTLFVALDQRSDASVILRLFSAEATIEHGAEILEQAAIAFEMSHPNVLRLTSFGRSTIRGVERAYVVHERLTGGSLQDMIDRSRLLTPSQALVVGLEVCRALDYAHKRGMLHHDLRPSSIVFGEDRKARVADIGVASVIAEKAWGDDAMVSQERARYCAPEQAQGEPFDEKTDVYALALILVEAVTGTVPFLTDSVVGTMSARVDKLFPVSADLGGLAAVLDKAGRSDPLERSSAADMGRALVQAGPTLPRPTQIPIVSSAIFGVQGEEDRTGDLTKPREFNELSDDSQSFVASTTDTMTIRDDADAVVAAGVDIEDKPLIGRWIVAAVAVLALITGGYFLFSALQKDSYAIPDLIGVDQGEATNLVTEFKWEIVVVEEANEELPVGAVIRTDPETGKKLETGKALTFVVSTGPPPVPLPELNGLDAATALATLTDGGLVLGVETPEYSEEVPVGVIIRWAISSQPTLVAGQEVIKGTAVDTFVSQGPAPRVVPDLTGMSIDSATSALTDLQLTINRGDDQFSIVAAGGVATQSPAAGESLARGTAVTVAISKGPDLVAVPQLLTLKFDKVGPALEAAGFVLGNVSGNTRGFPIAVFSAGQPVAIGQLLPRGTVLDVLYYGS
ncbi:MAG: PASTA domain-containing protein [Ilumatobacteraceae bacterium]|nr:PASTA domain-containing protein [Ilumatobacteraceae bacterium]